MVKEHPHPSRVVHGDFEFPIPDTVDLLYLNRQYSLFGRDRVEGWLRAKTGFKAALPPDKSGVDYTEDEYYEAFTEYLINEYFDCNT